MELGVAKIGSSASSVSSVRAALGVVLDPAAAAGEGAARAAGAADTASRASLGRFLAGSKRTRVPETGLVVGPAEAAARHTHAQRAGGWPLPQPPPPESSTAGGGGWRGPGSRAWVEGCYTCGRVLGASSTTSANPAREDGIKGESLSRALCISTRTRISGRKYPLRLATDL
jgi:hypothetical protein